MLSSLTPVGEASRHQRWGITAASHVLGAVIGGMVTGAVLAVAGAPLSSSLTAGRSLLVVAAAAVVGLAVDAVTERPPSWRRQVDERWLGTYRGWVYGAGFGAQLGLGWATVIPRSITYVLFVAMLLAGRVTAGLLVGAVFGLARAAPLALTRRAVTPARLRGLHRRLDALAAPADVGVRILQGTVAVAAAVGGLR